MRLRRCHGERPAWYIEIPLMVVGYLAFGVLRAWIDRGNPAATNNTQLIQQLEEDLHIAVEYPLNQAMLSHPFAIQLTGYFYRLCVLAVPAVLVWLYLTRPALYRRLRTVLVVITLLDLPLVWLFPEAPPRFALAGIVDYIATYDILNGAALRDPDSGLNLLAAMPSMHVAWTTWCAYAVWSACKQLHPRGALVAWLLPAVTAVVVVLTGHHYVLDVVAGAALVGVASRFVGTSGRSVH